MAGAAKIVDSSLRNIICFIILRLLNTLTSENGDIKNGRKITQIHWKERPMFWPEDICFVNLNNNLTTAKKWSMLFAAISCLLRGDIDELLSDSEKFVLCVELSALESSNIAIMNACHKFRIQATQNQDCSSCPYWVKKFLDKLSSCELDLAERYTGQDSTRILSIYHDLEQLCKNGRQPNTLKKLTSFRSMGSLDAESALNLAKECMEHKSTKSKRPSSSPGPHGNNKIPKTSGNFASSTQSPVTHIHNLGMQITASQTQPTQIRVLQSATSPRPVVQSSVIAFDASYSTAATTHFRSQAVCTTSVISTQTTATTPTVSPVAMNTNNTLLSSSGSHQSLIPLDTSGMSPHDQAWNTFKDNSFPDSCTSTHSEEYCVAFDKVFTLPDPV